MTPELYMKRCLELAQRGKGLTAPNPMVGAVLVYNEHIIAEGWHHRYGNDHAEVDCLNNVADGDKHLIPESTMYVSLEPCAHHGKTPPCAVRLVKEQIKKVIIANADPFDKVNGAGIQILKEGGIEVETRLLEQEGLWVNRRFFTCHTNKRPYIILKWAQTPDGYIAPETRERFQITNSHSMQLVHKWRTEEAAIMVGATTALNDNPVLTARSWAGRQLLRIILDRGLNVPATHNIYNADATTWIINELKDEPIGNITLVRLPFNEGLLPALFNKLYEHNILSLIIEGGAHLLTSVINSGVWDEARVFTGSTTIGSGIAAPLLHSAERVMHTDINTDLLNVYVNKATKYPYAAHMEL